jgi:GTP-binding protein
MTGQRLGKIFEGVERVREEFQKHIDTGPLNRKLAYWTAKQPPPIERGHRVKFFFVTQKKSPPPTFNFTVSRTGLVGESYERYLVNRIREEYGFSGVPVRMVYLPRTGRHEAEKRVSSSSSGPPKKAGARKPSKPGTIRSLEKKKFDERAGRQKHKR